MWLPDWQLVDVGVSPHRTSLQSDGRTEAMCSDQNGAGKGLTEKTEGAVIWLGPLGEEGPRAPYWVPETRWSPQLSPLI